MTSKKGGSNKGGSVKAGSARGRSKDGSVIDGSLDSDLRRKKQNKKLDVIKQKHDEFDLLNTWQELSSRKKY